ncbi:MAG TPA: ABC transporter substrate-binding protein [Thermoleophilia bacterium]
MAPRRYRGSALMVAVLALLAILLVPALAQAASPSPSASAGGLVLREGTTFDLDSSNLFVGYSATAYEAFHLSYSFLVGRGNDLQPRPELATSWSVSPDGLVWTFKLRSGVKWSDGQPFSASDVAFTYNYIIKNQLVNFTSYTENIDKAVAVDPLTVQIVCSKPKADMLYLWIPIVPEHIWAKVPGKRAGNDFQPKLPLVGTGPFQVAEVKSGGFVKLVKNPYYWDQPAIDEVLIQIYQNADTMTQELKSGALDYAWGLPTAQFKALSSEPGLKTNAADIRYFSSVSLNTYTGKDSLGDPALRDVAFRRALIWAVDKQRVVDISYGGYGSVAQGIITPDVPTYYWTPAADATYGFDLAKAGQMLDAAGYPLANGKRVGKDGKPITLRLYVRSASTESQSTGKLLAGWFEQLGLQIDLQTLSDGAIFDAEFNMKGAQYAPDYDTVVWGYGAYADPGFILSVFTTGQIGGWNDSYFSDPQYDKLYVQQSQTIDPTQRKPITDQMSQIVYDQVPYIVTTYVKQLEAFNVAKWTGWTQYGPTGPYSFSNDNVDSYINLRPKAAATTSTGSSTTWIYALIAAAAVIVVIAVVVAWRRSRRRTVEE